MTEKAQAPAQAKTNEPKITLTLPLSAVNLLAGALTERPYREAAPLLDEIGRQVEPQLRAASAPQEVAAEPEAAQG